MADRLLGIGLVHMYINEALYQIHIMRVVWHGTILERNSDSDVPFFLPFPLPCFIALDVVI